MKKSESNTFLQETVKNITSSASDLRLWQGEVMQYTFMMS